MIEIKNVDKYFNKGRKNEIHAINDTSLTLPDNGLIALLGESGCGKTTMLNAIGGLDKVKSGKIIINGQQITRHTMGAVDRIRNLNVGYIFQDYKLIDDMTVYDNVALALKMIGIKDKAEQKARVEYVLDKVGILRYRKRPCSTLSGGERQRVGIARALVKNPDIILADEPTGNLDSKNSVEIMNIIKKISKDRLVILVTHEFNLAKFYADRIIVLVDGKVVNDYENDQNDALDYEIDNVFYLKDFKSQNTFKDESNENTVNLYSDGKQKVDINIIVKNGNIYIQSNNAKNVELIDEHSGIDVVDDHKKEIDKTAIDDYDFDLTKVGNQNLKKRYSSINSFLTAALLGFKKIFSFSILRKLLLLGFFFVGVFIVFAVGQIGAVNNIDDADYITYNTNYVMIERSKMTTDEIETIETMEGVDYVLPSDSLVGFKVEFKDYYQTLNYGSVTLCGSLASTKLLTADMLTYGRLPENSNEIVVDKRNIDTYFYDNSITKMCGILSDEDIVGRTASLNTSYDNCKYTIVGIVDSGSPSIYVDESEFTKVLTYCYSYSSGDESYYNYFIDSSDSGTVNVSQYVDYKLYGDDIVLATKKSEYPEDYEVLISENLKDMYAIGKSIGVKLNGKNLTVSGYYKEKDGLSISGYLVNENTVRINQILNSERFIVCSTNSLDNIVSSLDEMKYTAYGTLQSSKETYDEERADSVKSTYIAAAIILAISAIEMYLMSRSSFLSRIKEVGTLRAIGAKKLDIYKMFVGEAIAISTLMSLPGMVLTFAFESFLCKKMSLLCSLFYMPVPVLIAAIICVYAFNVIISLLPVWNVMRKRPAAILARFDVD